MQANSVICDTTVWLYLGRIGHLTLLQQLYNHVYVTEAVCLELDTGRLQRADTVDPRPFNWATTVLATQQMLAQLPPSRLGRGELSSIAYALAHQIDIVGLDDRQARALAKSLNLNIRGTIGILIQAKQAGLISAIRPLLHQLRQNGMYIAPSLLQAATASVGE